MCGEPGAQAESGRTSRQQLPEERKKRWCAGFSLPLPQIVRQLRTCRCAQAKDTLMRLAPFSQDKKRGNGRGRTNVK